MCQGEGTQQIVLSFSPPVVDCLLTKSSQKRGGGVTDTPTPLSYASASHQALSPHYAGEI